MSDIGDVTTISPKDMSGRDYRVVVRVKNAKLLRQMERCGIRSQTHLSESTGVNIQTINKLCLMKIGATRINGEWRTPVEILASFLQCSPDEIIPDGVKFAPLPKNGGEIDVSIDGIESFIQSLSDPNATAGLLSDVDVEKTTVEKHFVRRLVQELRPRAQIVIKKYFGIDGPEMTCEEIGIEMNLSRGRVNQIVRISIMKMAELSRRFDMRDKTKRIALT